MIKNAIKTVTSEITGAVGAAAGAVVGAIVGVGVGAVTGYNIGEHYGRQLILSEPKELDITPVAEAVTEPAAKPKRQRKTKLEQEMAKEASALAT